MYRSIFRLPRARLEALLWLALVSFLGYRIWPQFAAAFGVTSSSVTAPDFQLTTIEGAHISRETLAGKVVLINFWATWCPPCRLEMPGFQDVYASRMDQGFTIVGISTDATGAEHVRRYLSKHGITYPIAMATSAVVNDFGGPRALPTSFLIDRQGRIRHTVTGIFTEVALERAIGRLLAEAPVAARDTTGGR